MFSKDQLWWNGIPTIMMVLGFALLVFMYVRVISRFKNYEPSKKFTSAGSLIGVLVFLGRSATSGSYSLEYNMQAMLATSVGSVFGGLFFGGLIGTVIFKVFFKKRLAANS